MELTEEDKAVISEAKARKRMVKQHRNHKLMIVQGKERRGTKMYLSLEAKKELLNECSAQAFVLHTYYTDLAEDTSRELTDTYLSQVSGWSTQAVQRHRLALEKANWFRKYTIVGGKENNYSATYYLLDKETVLRDMNDKEFNEVFQETIKNQPESVVKQMIQDLKDQVV